MPETENTATTEETNTEITAETAPEAAEETTQTAEATPETIATETAAEEAPAEVPEEEISYHAVEKEGNVTAIWEMQGRKHLRTIAPRSAEGKHILSLFTSEHHDEAA